MRNSLCGLIVLLASSVAQADTIYDNGAAWNASVTGVTTITFDAFGPVCNSEFNPFGTYYGEGPGASIVVGGVSFGVGPASPEGELFVVCGLQFRPEFAVTVADDLLITLPSAVTALAFDFNNCVGAAATITLSDGTVATETPVPDWECSEPTSWTTTFFGVTAPGGLTSVDITSDDYGIYVDGFSEGTVPEPSSLLLLGAGLAGVAGMLRRRRRSN